MAQPQKKQWEDLATTEAEALGLSVEDLKKEVQRELIAQVAKKIVAKVRAPKSVVWGS